MSITFKEVEHIYSENTPFAYHALKGVNLKITERLLGRPVAERVL